MDTKKLRQKILDLAIHGKLVPQDPNDEPASVLLERIRAEKEALIKEGKIKRSKKSATSDTSHYENVPFEVPEGWCWCRLEDITDYGKCQTSSIENIEDDRWVLELEDIEKDTGKVLKRCTKAEREIRGVRHSFCKGNVLYSKLRTYLNKVLVADKDGFCTTEIIPIKCSDSIYPEYLCHVLRSKYFLDYTAQCGYGVKMPRLSTTDACKAMVPVPPLGEQKRIVTQIEGILSLIDFLDEGKQGLDQDIKQARSKILDLAIHGKLVSQDPTDEPASELLKRINPNAGISCDNPHYLDLPNGWILCNLENVIELYDNYRKPINGSERQKRKSGKTTASLYPYYGATGLVDYIDSYLLDGQYILLGEDGAPFLDASAKKAFIVQGKFWVNNHAHVLKSLISTEYLVHVLNCFDYGDYVKGSTRLKLTQKDMLGIPVYLPPYNEQLRIVSMVNDLFSQLDMIETSLQA